MTLEESTMWIITVCTQLMSGVVLAVYLIRRSGKVLYLAAFHSAGTSSGVAIEILQRDVIVAAIVGLALFAMLMTIWFYGWYYWRHSLKVISLDWK